MTYNPEQSPANLADSPIAQSAPELLDGRLPAELQLKIDQQFGPDAPFAIGVNQSGGAGNTDEADQYVAKHNGIDMGYTDFTSRFQIYDEAESYNAEAMLDGFYGPDMGGRFVVVFPTQEVPGHSAGQVARESRDYLPDDFIVEYSDQRGDAQESVNPKYVCGFIDQESGAFKANKNFLGEGAPDFSAEQDPHQKEINDLGSSAVKWWMMEPDLV